MPERRIVVHLAAGQALEQAAIVFQAMPDVAADGRIQTEGGGPGGGGIVHSRRELGGLFQEELVGGATNGNTLNRSEMVGMA
jgi:hypothetical protein